MRAVTTTTHWSRCWYCRGPLRVLTVCGAVSVPLELACEDCGARYTKEQGDE